MQKNFRKSQEIKIFGKKINPFFVFYKYFYKSKFAKINIASNCFYFLFLHFKFLFLRKKDTPGGKMYHCYYDGGVSRNLELYNGNYEAEKFETMIFRTVIKKNMLVVDVGAHFGYYTLIAANIAGAGGKVFAFEPCPQNYKLLKLNIKINKYANIIPLQYCILDEKRNVKLYISPNNSGDNRISATDERRPFIYVNSITLDEFFHGKEKLIDVIKIDTQGAEFMVLKSMHSILSTNNHIICFTELWPQGLENNKSSLNDFYNLLTKYNFYIFYIDEENQKLTRMNLSKLSQVFIKREDCNLLCIKESFNLSALSQYIN
jgi:FkbM family methyltransferase